MSSQSQPLTATSSITTTQGVRIEVRPEFDSERSNLEASIYVYAYHITITNEGSETVQLLSRHWEIRDGFNKVEHVVGEGVVGQKPVLKPQESFRYTSFCPLTTPTGSMKGSFQMRAADEKTFDADITEFHLRAKELLN